ncbi:MAG: serine/threonine-protein phosphatase [Actinomycetales bacterium]|nr:serine/threonine-protein phosphatase [Actinomycetales bacterium]
MLLRATLLGPGADREAGSRSFRLPYLGVWGPLGVSVVVLTLDLLEGDVVQYVGLLVAMPFFAAALVGPRATAVVGLTVLAMGFGFGFLQDDGQPGPVWSSLPQLVRLAFVAAATAGGVAVSSIRLRREDRLRSLSSVAAAAQMAIMRPVEPQVGPVRCAVRYSSAAEEAQVGGDLVEVLDTPFGVRAIVGDVRGKGLDAVRMAAQVLGSFREQAFVAPDLGEVAMALDASVRRLAAQEDFVTVLLLQVRRDGSLRVLSCGHPAPLLVPHPDDGVALGVQVLETEPHHPPLGLLAETPGDLGWRLGTGDRLIAVTDGMLEARREGRFFDASAALRRSLDGRSLEQGMDTLLGRLAGFVHGHLTDDVAVLGIEFVGRHRSSGPGRQDGAAERTARSAGQPG